MNDCSVVTIVHDHPDLYGSNTTRVYIGCNGPAIKLCTWALSQPWVKSAEIHRVSAMKLEERPIEEVGAAGHILQWFADYVA